MSMTKETLETLAALLDGREYGTDISHATFTVMEDGEPWCRGIVFSLADLASTEAGQ